MLESINLNDKTYAEMLEDAISDIPLYGSEWNNFNLSDPGITILQNLTAFNYLQQLAVNTVTDAIKFKLLALLGFTPRKAQAAEVFAEFVGKKEVELHKYRKFLSQDTVFEIGEDELCRPWGLEAVYCEDMKGYSDVTGLLDRSLNIGAIAVFGTPVRTGAALCLVLNGKPDMTKELLLYAAVQDDEERNPFESNANRPFAEVVWQIYTANGWETADVVDGTHGFLVSGEIILKPSTLEPAVFTGAPVSGYALRCALAAHEYDMTPRLRSLTANLTRLVQRDTMAAMHILRGGVSRAVFIDPVYPYVSVYGRENASSRYRAYKNAAERAEDGAYTYTVDHTEDGIFDFRFDGEGVPPGEGEGDLILVCCTEEMERFRSLGAVLGYVDQEMDIELSGDIITDDFVIMLETTDPDGLKSYEPVKPGEASRDGFLYELITGKNKVCVRNPEIGRDCRAYIVSCAVTLGAEGNVREENMFETFKTDGDDHSDAYFINPAPGRGGVTPGSLTNLRGRFSSGMKAPWTAVTAADYESIVLSAPGLCIHKVKAIPNPSENLVQIVVKPRGENRFPNLSASYIRRITELLESRRMLTAKFVLVQPRYLPINVRTSIFVKSRSANARADIERVIGETLDFVSSDADFGTPVLFDKVFDAIADLPCVITITDLSLTPGSRGFSVQNGLDIIPEGRCLCYPGKISIEINARAER